METKTRKIKYYELFNINKGLEELNGVAGVQLGIYRGRLSREVAKHIEDMQSYTKTDEWQRIDNLVEKINNKYTLKEETGQPIIRDKRYVFDPTREADRIKELEEFSEKEKEAISERERLIKEYNSILKETTPFELITIPLSVIKDIETVYAKLEKESPFKSEIIDLLISIINMEA